MWAVGRKGLMQHRLLGLGLLLALWSSSVPCALPFESAVVMRIVRAREEGMLFLLSVFVC